MCEWKLRQTRSDVSQRRRESANAARGHHDGSGHVVRQDVMVFGPPEQRVSGVAGGDLGQHAQTVDVSDDGGGGDEPSFSAVEVARDAGDAPSDEEVFEDVHARSSRTRYRSVGFLNRTRIPRSDAPVSSAMIGYFDRINSSI